jgi:parallel beta-helix repeat protein
MNRRVPVQAALVFALVVVLMLTMAGSAAADHFVPTTGAPLAAASEPVGVDGVHYTYTGPTSVTFDWRGTATDIRYGDTTAYGATATAQTANPTPFSSGGPFQEVRLTGLAPGTTYHYSIGGGADQTFTTAPTGNFRFDVMADIGSSLSFANARTTQNEVAADSPAFVLGVGDLTYAHPFGQPEVDQHFNDVMVWSQTAAYMPVWGNHEWEEPADDDLRNYKGRFELPNPQTSTGAPAAGCCGEDWGWFDAGGVRFISYPEPYESGTWANWQQNVDPIMAAAQADPSIRYIVTFGHRPAYSTGFHKGDSKIASILNTFGDTYSKYMLNLNGHSHNYERFAPIHNVTHITSGGGGASLELPWSAADSQTAYRAMHLEHLRIDVGAGGMRIEAVCGPPTSKDDITCVEGSVLDSYTIGAAPPAPPPSPTTFYVDKNNPNCSNIGTGSVTQPYCAISAATPRAIAGTTVLVASGTYNEQVTPKGGSPNNPVSFGTLPGANVTVTGGTYGFYLSGKSWVTIEGFNVTDTVSDGFRASNGGHINLIGNHVSRAGEPVSGQAAKGMRLGNITDSLFAYNTIDHNSEYGIYLTNGSTRNQVTGNRISFNASEFQRVAAGIRLYDAPANTISFNVSHDNEDSGIELYTGSNANYVVGNVTYTNGDHGIDVYNSTAARVTSNSVYKNIAAGINFESNSPGSMANNVSVDNAINGPRTKGNIRVDSTSTAGSTIDYDLVNIPYPNPMITWGTTFYKSVAAFVAITGQEAHGIQADPKWAAPAQGDLHLTAGSRAIDSADAGATGETATDADGEGRIDDPFTPNTGVGHRVYDDRGAYEYQFEAPPEAPPVAALSVTPSSGKVNLDVTADASGSTDTDLTPIDSYRFDFGDGSAAVGPQAGATANHTYTAAGTYTVTVTVEDTAGLSSTQTSTVTVTDSAPAASLSVQPTPAPIPLAVTADASASTDTDGTPIDSYRFDFGDGSAAVGPQAAATAGHTYTAAGTYTVTVTVTDTAGLSSTATASVHALPAGDRNQGFEADLSGWNTAGGGSGITLTRVSGGHLSLWSGQLTNTLTTASTCLLNDSPNAALTTSAGRYTGTLWARADTAGAVLKLRFREYAGSTLAGTDTSLITLSTSWQQVTVAHTTVSPGSTLDFNAYVTSAAPGTCFYADDVAVYLS